ncbi:MAG: NAD-binding protein [Pseudomonadota bacterium]
MATAPPPRRHMLSLGQRVLAQLHYLRRPVLRFFPVLLVFCAVLLLGGLAFHLLYRRETLDYPTALYVTYSLVFMEHLLPWPKHLLLQILYFALPPLGLVVLLDGLVQFGGRVLRRDATSREWNHAMIETLRDHVILCGLGKAGIRTLEVLVRLGEKVCVLEKDPHSPNLAWARQHGVPVIIGSGREAGIFEQLNTEHAKSIILATDDDLANLEMALDARKVNATIHVVLRLFDQELAQKIRDSFDIPVAFSTTALAAPLFATASSDSTIVNAFEVGGTLLVVARVQVAAGSTLVGSSVGELTRPHNLWALSLERGDDDKFCPDETTVLAAGDVLTVQTEPAVLRELHKRNRVAS